jgi:TonB family protein
MMVVTTGPTGGGGLRVYGVLKGKKIYTVYLPMPEKNWILQYCARDSAAAGQEPERRNVEVKLEVPVAPPSAVEQFDFRRPPVPVSPSEPNRNETIILQGVIEEDGSVGELKVYKGVGAIDQAALAAFRRWKFRPAQRQSKPIAVEILVGIPIVLPAK